MREQRHVVEKNGRFLIAIPAGVREHLGLVGGAQVWWHTVKGGEAAVTTTGQRRAGRSQRDADCPSCAGYREELTRMRGGARGRVIVDYNTAFSQGVAQGVKIVPIWRAELDTLHTEVNDMRRLLAQLVVRLPERRIPRRQRGPARAALPEHDPPYADDFDAQGRVIPREPTPAAPPDPPSSPGAIDGGADTSGAEPPGVPL